ncbi:MAG TPA: hypothetical protein VFY59_19450, partial [Rubrobacter sp.]|nr:hypothetical protein [Rubrobacter sp.]
MLRAFEGLPEHGRPKQVDLDEMEPSSTPSSPESAVAASTVTAMTLVYSAPTPGTGSRYMDGRVAHESRVL